MACKTYKAGELQQYKYVVVLSRYQGKILLSRHKDRTTWETQGGHIEPGETPLEAAKRELYEESGAVEFALEPVCDYCVGEEIDAGAGGMVFAADIRRLGDLPNSEMAEVGLFDTLPENLTYPDITPILFARIGYYCFEEATIHDFRNISLTGRLCYLFMCIEKYLVSCYPNKDWMPVAEKCWQWTNGMWDEGCDKYSQVVPEFLLEFDNYNEANKREFDGMLSEKDYLVLTDLYAGITDGSAENEINRLLMLPMDFNNACEGTSFCAANGPTMAIIFRAQSILLSHNILCPGIDEISCLTTDQEDGWGNRMDSEYLSIIMEKAHYRLPRQNEPEA